MASSVPGNTRDPLREQKSILAIVHKFLSGIQLRNPELMHSYILSTGHALLIRPVANQKTSVNEIPNKDVPSTRQHLQITLPEVVERIPFDSPVSIEENIALTEWEEGDDGEKYGGRKSEIRVDDDFAFAWTPYEVRLGGVLHHVGTNVFSLVRRLDGPEKGDWVISYVADTYRNV